MHATCCVHSVPDCETSTWPPYVGGTAMDIVAPLRSFEHTLGMARRHDVDRQLTVDLPRSYVLARDGATRLLRPGAVHRETRHGRFCTQAVCAPVLEWFMHAGLFAWEVPGGNHPLRVAILRDGGVYARKRLMLSSEGMVEIAVYASGDAVVVSSQPSARGAPRVRAPILCEDD